MEDINRPKRKKGGLAEVLVSLTVLFSGGGVISFSGISWNESWRADQARLRRKNQVALYAKKNANWWKDLAYGSAGVFVLSALAKSGYGGLGGKV